MENHRIASHHGIMSREPVPSTIRSTADLGASLRAAFSEPVARAVVRAVLTGFLDGSTLRRVLTHVEMPGLDLVDLGNSARRGDLMPC
jgi:hypothetical protein